MKDHGTSPSEVVPGFAIVRFGRHRSWLRPGDELTFGRGEDRDIRIGYDPRDDLVSREAGSFTGLRDGVLIRNTSRTQSIKFLAMPGPELAIRPGMAIGSMPYGHIRVEVLGRHGRCYALHLDARGMAAPPSLEAVGTRSSSKRERSAAPTQSRPRWLSPRELKLLAALCEPQLTLSGRPPATYREIAERLGSSATHNSVRTGLDRLRNRLSDEDGIPGLRGDDAAEVSGSRDATHYVEALAWWAIDTRQVSANTLDLILPARDVITREQNTDPRHRPAGLGVDAAAEGAGDGDDQARPLP